ncbi:hypothetical protein ACUNWD_11325 [Sunxiuqinia sp. A32]|uniref:hypothetical protein n=1 Tax=Sunxiuqinia sp. A32 TaxID=3461496 RepID=UPI004046070C
MPVIDKDETLVVFPDSLELKIKELKQQGDDFCDICRVEVIQFEGEEYYSLYCDLWSCIYCHVYDEEGNEISWEQETWESFVENHEVIQTVPICQD